MSMLTVSLSACSAIGLNTPWSQSESESASLDQKLIAENLVNTLAQFPHLNPLMSTVQALKPASSFARDVEDELRERGYKIERISAPEGLYRVNAEIRQASQQADGEPLYMLTIGQVSAERAYKVIADKTVPVSEQIIRGTRQRTVALNDDIFEVPQSEYSVVAFKAYEGPSIEDLLAPPALGAASGSWWKPEPKTVVKRNIYETMTSNYQGVFAGYEDIDQSILVFPNDSLRLGDVNKGIIERFVAEMDPNTDILSVIGCSHGETEISNGNSLLALGRANRVKEALMFSGLEHDQILDEGCWAPQLFDEVMPRRGVVLTLKRQSKS
ncbi:hypothetical protein [Granulosicoccus antarcticus]|uniref:hypothetical protein n=1 Tax=Granulosicoccus antarcticus TaxID=437505 RepID=UPI0012FDDBFB|nr:hypothetical protein [Granulosicoccus antarcticus]